MADHPKGAILQRDKQTYAIVPRTPVGIVTPDDLESLAKVVRKYQIPVIKITSGQRFALVGMQKEDVNKIWDELGMDVGKAVELCLHYVQACPGTAVCKFGTQDSLGLGTEIESFFPVWNFRPKLKSVYPAARFAVVKALCVILVFSARKKDGPLSSAEVRPDVPALETS